jgi:[ribosomal protein S5]-alanine N-acetyltransferase
MLANPGAEETSLSFSAMVSALNREGHAGRALPFVLTVRGRIAGQVTVGGITYGAYRGAHIGYWIDESLAGHGYTTMAVALAADYCFSALHLHRLEINIRPENERSRRVAEKCGFVEEGLRSRYLHIDGAWRDHICYVMFSEDVPVGGVMSIVTTHRGDAR